MQTLAAVVLSLTMFTKSTPPGLTDEDKAWLCERLGHAVACLAYAESARLGDVTAANLEALPENVRLGLRFQPEVG